MKFRFTTAGESHGQALVAVIEGLPAAMPVDVDKINRELWRRQQGYGRGARQKIESDTAKILSGVRHSATLGSPVAVLIENKDWRNWEGIMSVETPAVEPKNMRRVTRPRPGHADLAGGQKFGARDLRNILERASARETAARVAVGAFAKQLLEIFGVEICSHVVQLGGVPEKSIAADWETIKNISDESPLHCADAETEREMIAAIDRAKAAGDTLGGTFEIAVKNCVPGLGSHTSWSEKLDGRFAQAFLSIPAVKAFEIGEGIQNAARLGSEVHDEIGYDVASKSFSRATNRAGGLEGGITTGEELRLRGFLKPISTLRKPLNSVEIETKEISAAAFERSDVTAVPAAGVIGEAMTAIVLAEAMREKFGGDSLPEMQRNFAAYQKQLQEF